MPSSTSRAASASVATVPSVKACLYPVQPALAAVEQRHLHADAAAPAPAVAAACFFALGAKGVHVGHHLRQPGLCAHDAALFGEPLEALLRRAQRAVTIMR